jgi:hypothetical protein
MKNLFFFIILHFIAISVSAQENSTLLVSVDTTKIKIGEQVEYKIRLSTDSINIVIFPETPFFSKFEVLEESELDTLKLNSKFLYTKKYSITQFDSGKYYLPRQKVLVNDLIYYSDSIPITVFNVEVDTLRQKLYDIKPIQSIQKNYDALIQNFIWFLVFIIFLSAILYSYFFQKKRKKLRELETPPFERAIKELKLLESENPILQLEFKNYYSRLTNVVRRYIEEEVKLDAMESTSEQLIIKLQLRVDSGSLELDKEILKNLKSVLQNADLVKFAKSTPQHGIANTDCKIVESVVLKTQEALPEPTEEELLKQEAYIEALSKKRKKEQFIWSISIIFIIFFIALLSCIAFYGYYPVRDTIFRHPTKVLQNKDWIKSQYGVPPIIIETPEVLRRVPSDNNIQIFEFADLESSFYIGFIFTFNPSLKEDGKKNPKNLKTEQNGQKYIDEIISSLESKGAVNILIKDQEITLSSGTSATKLFGTFDYSKSEVDKMVRHEFSTIIFAYDDGFTKLLISYKKNDRYAKDIEEKVINSIELIKDL